METGRRTPPRGCGRLLSPGWGVPQPWVSAQVDAPGPTQMGCSLFPGAPRLHTPTPPCRDWAERDSLRPLPNFSVFPQISTPNFSRRKKNSSRVKTETCLAVTRGQSPQEGRKTQWDLTTRPKPGQEGTELHVAHARGS